MTKQNPETPSTDLNFERAFARLEEILDQMNSGQVSLDESLRLYEEADKLINFCGRRLGEAERKIQILIKNRNGDLATDQEGNPRLDDFDLPSSIPK